MRRTAVLAGVTAVALLVGAMPASAGGGGEPVQIREEYVEEYQDPELAAACGIATVEVVELGTANVKVFPNGEVLVHRVERGTWSNPATGDEVFSLQSGNQLSSAEVSLDGDVLTIVQDVTYAGQSDRMLAPGQGVVFTRAGRFEDRLTIRFDISTSPPTLISFDEERISTAGTIRDSFSDDELSRFCAVLGGSFSP